MEVNAELNTTIPENVIKLNDEDRKLLLKATKALHTYYVTLGELPEEKLLALSYAQSIMWQQVEDQLDFLLDITNRCYIEKE